MKNILFIILALTFLASAFGQFSLIPVGGDTVKIYAFDILSFVFAFLGLVTLFSVKRKVTLSKYILYASFFSLFALITLVASFRNHSVREVLVSSFYLLRYVNYVVVAFVLSQLINVDKTLVQKLINLMVASAVFVAIAGFVQLAFFPNLSDLPAELGWDPHMGRLASTFFDPNFVGGYLVLAIILCALLLWDRKFKVNKPMFSVALVILIIALILTFSRSSYLMFSGFVLLLGLFKSKRLLLLFLVLMFVTYYSVPRIQTRLSGVTDPQDSAKYRLISWTNTLQIAKDNLLLGVGFNTFRYSQEEYGFFTFADDTGGHAGAGSDSSLLLVLATTGIFGLFLFLLIYFELIRGSYQTYTKGKNSLALAVLISSISILVHSQFVNSIFYPQFLLWFSSLSALAQKPSASRR